jgi:hypothetical protein
VDDERKTNTRFLQVFAWLGVGNNSTNTPTNTPEKSDRAIKTRVVFVGVWH